MRGICKAYGAVQANRGIDLTVPAGAIVGLLGENGSGKSTLMKVLFGMVRPDAGGIVYKGRELDGGSPKKALAAGIAMIHQHFTLIDAMTVVDNVMLGADGRSPWLDRAATVRRLREAAAAYGLDVDPQARVEDLALGERQRVEILKAVLRGADLLILDEPTSILSPPEIEQLLQFLRRFRDGGRSVVFITHKLGEVLAVADNIVVLRDGAVAGALPAAEATRESLARMMVGRELRPTPPRRAAPRGRERLRVESLAACDAAGVPRLVDASFTLRAGEVLALAGIDGNGQGELADTLAGLSAPVAGRIVLDGADITRGDARARLAAGIAYIPADRAGTSLVQSMSIEDNLMLRDADAAPFSRHARIDRAALRRAALERMQAFDVRAASATVPARTLSGGNQQKVVLARELARRPALLIAFQPTWGLDPLATRFVIDSILRLRDEGGAVLYISSELEEVLAVGDRIGVLSAGRIVDIVDRAEVDLPRIGLAMAGSGGPALRQAA
jgi:ABC-type uncharacterized transport system ATPase subunit